jgi:hypothetical protein
MYQHLPSRGTAARGLLRARPLRSVAVVGALVVAAACGEGLTDPAAAAATAAPPGPRYALGLANNASADTLAIGETVQLSASSLRTNRRSTATVWSTSNAAIATVSSTGLVTAVAAGVASITASNGTSSQKADMLVRAAALAAAPAPAPDPSSAAASVLAFMGAANTPSVATLQALGGAWAKYESDFAVNAETRWTTDGASNTNANYYDRAMIYYVWWARTGNATYLDRANQLAINHRTWLESVSYKPQPYQLMIDGVALHALVTGDQRSKDAVGRVADMLAGPNGSWTHIVGDPANQYMDARSAGRVLALALDAWYLKVQSPSGVNWATQTQFLASEVMRSQAADGAFRYASTCWYSKPFMSGIAIEALVRYHQSFQPDARVADAVKRGVDYLWTKNWVPTAQAFTYIEGSCNGEVPGATADLNNLAVSGFGLAASTTGDATYLTRGDAVFSGGVYGAWIGGSKHFNQQYTSSYRYLGFRLK